MSPMTNVQNRSTLPKYVPNDQCPKHVYIVHINVSCFINQTFHSCFSKENEDRKKNLEDINEWIRTENEKRMAEAEALRARSVLTNLSFFFFQIKSLCFRMEREKQELQDFLERDNKAMRDRMSQEEEERQRKEREMQVRNPGEKIPNFLPR